MEYRKYKPLTSPSWAAVGVSGGPLAAASPEYRKYKATFPLAHPPAPPGAPPAAPALRSQRRPLDGGGWPCGLVLGDGLPARLGLLGGTAARAGRLGLLGGGLRPRGGIKRDERC